MTITNPYYEFSPTFIPGTKARSDAVNLQYAAIQNAFDFLPASSDAITTGTATFAVESGAGNAYVVTMPDPRTAEADGDEIVFFSSHANTAAATIDVDGLGAKAIVTHEGDALVADDILDGIAYVVRYDATNVRYQLVSPSGNAASSASAAAASAVEAMQWAVNPEDDDVDSDPGMYSAFHWAQKALAAGTSGSIVTDITTATPPTNEAVSGEYAIYDVDSTDQLARFGYVASNDLTIGNLMHGGSIILAQEDAAGASQPLSWDGSELLLPNTKSINWLDDEAASTELLTLGASVEYTWPQITSWTYDAGYNLNTFSQRNAAYSPNGSRILYLDDDSSGGFRISADMPTPYLPVGGIPTLILDTAINSLFGLGWVGAGTKIYTGTSGGKVDVRTNSGLANVPGSGDIGSIDSTYTVGQANILQMHVKEDGTQLWYCPNNTNGVRAVDIATPHDLTTASDVAVYNPAEGGAGTVTSVGISASGTEMWLTISYATIYEYVLSTAFDITSATYTGRSTTPSSQPVGSTFTDFDVSPDGTHWIQTFSRGNIANLNETGHLTSAGSGVGTPGLFSVGDPSYSVQIDGLAVSIPSGVSAGAPIFIAEQAAAATSEDGLGQYWVKSDTPNVPMFTDDAGEDFILNVSGSRSPRTARYLFDQSTSAASSPDPGYMRYRATAPESASGIFLAFEDADGNDMRELFDIFDALDCGHINVRIMEGPNQRFQSSYISSAGYGTGGMLANGFVIEAEGPNTQIPADTEMFVELDPRPYVDGSAIAADTMLWSDGGNIYASTGSSLKFDSGGNAPGKLHITSTSTTNRSRAILYHEYGVSGQGASAYYNCSTAGKDFATYVNMAVTPGTMRHEATALSVYQTINTDGQILDHVVGTEGRYLEERTAASAVDIAGFGQIWVKDETTYNDLYFTDDTGQDVQLTNNGAIAGASQTPWTSDIDAASFNLTDVDEVQGSGAFVVLAAEDSTTGQPYAGYNIDMAAGVATHLLTGAISGVLYQNSGDIRFYSDTSQTAGTTATPQLILSGTDATFAGDMYPGGQTLGHLEAVTGAFGSVQADGLDGSSGIWAGYSIGGRLVFMDNVGATTANRGGLYDDVNNYWIVEYNGSEANGEVELHYAGSQKLVTTNTGVEVTGDVFLNGNIELTGSNPDIFLNDAGSISFENDVGSANPIVLSNPSFVSADPELRIASDAATPYVRFYDGMRVMYYDNTNTDWMRIQVTTGGFAAITTSGVDGVGFGDPIYIIESAAAAADNTAYGQIWVRNRAANQLWFTDDAGADFPVATAAAKVRTNTASDMQTDTIAGDLVNGVCFFDNGTAYTITLEPSAESVFPLEASFQIIDAGTGVITINEGTGDTLYLIESDGTVTDTAGGCTMTGGVATVYRSAAAIWYIWGSNITA